MPPWQIAVNVRVHGVAIRRLAGALPGAPQQLEDAALRKFGRGADAAVERIDLAQQSLGDAVEHRGLDSFASLGLAKLAKRLAQDGDVFRHLVAVAAIGVGDALQHLGKPGRPQRGSGGK